MTFYFELVVSSRDQLQPCIGKVKFPYLQIITIYAVLKRKTTNFLGLVALYPVRVTLVKILG